MLRLKNIDFKDKNLIVKRVFRIRRIRKFLGSRIRIRIRNYWQGSATRSFYQQEKKIEKTLDYNCFVTFSEKLETVLG